MDHHVANPASGLKGRQGISQFRIQDGKDRTQSGRSAQTQLLQGSRFGNDRIARPFTACSRNGQHNPHLQGCLHRGTPYEKVPKVTFITSTGGNGFRCIDDRSTSNGQHQVCLFTLANVNAFIHLGVNRIGLHASHLAIRQSGGIERMSHSFQQPAFHG